MVPTLYQSTKPSSSSFSESQKSRKLDFENVIYVLDLEPEDSGYKLLSALTNNGKLSIISVISLSRSELKEVRIVDNNKATLAFDDWEVAEIFNLCSYFMHKRSENENFQLRDIEPESFESFKLSPICDQMTHTRRNMSRSTKGQPNLSRPSISPASIGSTSSSSIGTPPSISPTTKGEEGSLKGLSYSLNGEVNSSLSIEPSFIDISKTINKEKMVTSFPIKKIDPSSIDPYLIERSQIPALNESKGQGSATNEDCIDSSYSFISSKNELSLEDSSEFHSSSTSNSFSSNRIP